MGLFAIRADTGRACFYGVDADLPFIEKGNNGDSCVGFGGLHPAVG